MTKRTKTILLTLLTLGAMAVIVVPLWWWALFGMSEEVGDASFWTAILIVFVSFVAGFAIAEIKTKD